MIVMMVVFNVNTAKIIDSIPIGDNPDGIAFDPINRMIFIANGNGIISVISQLSPDDYALVESIPTKKGSNSLAFDETTSSIFVPGADQYPAVKSTGKQAIPPGPRWIPSSFQVMVFDKM